MNMDEIMHIVLKYNDSVYNIDTIKEHSQIIEKEGKVIWGIIKPSIKSPGVGAVRVNKIKSQIEDGKEVIVYFSTNSQIKHKAKVLDILNNIEVINNDYLVPEYYHKDLERCVSGILLTEIEAIDPSIINNLQKYGSDRGQVALSNQTNPLYVSWVEKDSIGEKHQEIIIPSQPMNLSVKNIMSQIYKYINAKGFIFSYEDICNFYLSLKTKPFVILAGISGTGKSKLVELFSEAVNATSTNGRYRIISVKPDWNDSTELFGYKNINDDFIPGVLTSIIFEASKKENINKPYFICLDEMNLARVEYYLSEYLSIIESRKLTDNQAIETEKVFPRNYLPKDSIYSDLKIPDNVYIVGTVNMDDTTFAFSRKVLDRANTLEFSEVRLEELEYLDEQVDGLMVDNSVFKTQFLSLKHSLRNHKDYIFDVNSKIIQINSILEAANSHFGYRVRDEIVFYMLENKLNNLLDEDLAFDYQILQKILPTISGSDYYIKQILIQLYNFCNPEGEISEEISYIDQGMKNLDTAVYVSSAKKILFMLRGYENGFASFW